MKTLHFSVAINSTCETVWDILWDDETYPQWTSVFDPGSRAVSDWHEGSRIYFTGSNGDGMFSEIARKDFPQLMSFRHLGVVKDGKEQHQNEETKKWSGAMENYTLRETAGHTELLVDLDTTEEHEKYFSEAFPKALQKVKELSEAAT